MSEKPAVFTGCGIFSQRQIQIARAGPTEWNQGDAGDVVCSLAERWQRSPKRARRPMKKLRATEL
jgi:hypothetical protein